MLTGEEGIITKAQEAKIYGIIGTLKEELRLEQMYAKTVNKNITMESLLAEGKVRRMVEIEVINTEENYYINYAIKDGAFEGMENLGKGRYTDVFLVDEDLNVRYIAGNGKEYGDNVKGTLLEDDTQIRFASKVFGDYISRKIGKTEEQVLFKWMKTQTSLEIPADENIDNLEDLVFFPNLTKLTINYSINILKSLSGIENCRKLNQLDLIATSTQVNGIAPQAEYSFEPLGALTNLTELNFQRASVSDKNWNSLIDNISGLKNLETLNCGAIGRGVLISAVPGIDKLTQLKNLSLCCDNLSNIPRGLNKLKNLNSLVILSYITKIENINNLTNLTSLEIRSYAQSSITEITGLDNLNKLETLNLNSNKITEIKGLDNLNKLETLMLSGNKITEIKGLDNLSNLKTLDLSNNQITDITPLYKNTNLMTLNLKGNTGIEGYRSRYSNEQLEKIDIIGEILDRGGKIDIDADKLGLFNGYTSLDLNNLGLTDLSILEGKTKLTTLNLSNNQITLSDEKSRKILASLTELKSLSLNNNNLSDISAINSLTKLTELYLSGDNNNVNLKQIEDRISSLNSFACNETTFKTITNCTPSKITKITFSWGGFSGALPEDLSKLTSLATFDLPACSITNLSPLSDVTSLKTLNLRNVSLHERLDEIDFAKLTGLTYLRSDACGLWDVDLVNLLGLKDNEDLILELSNNAIIDARVLLQFNTTCKIWLAGNQNLSQESKDALNAKFGTNVRF